MKCVLIGGGGFIGRVLGRALIARGHDVIGFDVAPARDSDLPPFPIEHCDLMEDDIELPARADVVFYLAQSPHYRAFPHQASHLFGVNTFGAIRAAEAARGAGVRLFCYASSGTIYQPSFAPLREDHPVRRDHGYSLSKVFAEEALASMAEDVPVLRARFFGVFGRGQRRMLVDDVTERIRAGRPVTLERNPHDADDHGGLRLSVTYVDDLAGCLCDLIEHVPFHRLNRPLNIAGDRGVCLRELGESIGRILEIEPRFELLDRVRESDFIADISGLREFISPHFTPLEDAIASIMQAHV